MRGGRYWCRAARLQLLALQTGDDLLRHLLRDLVDQSRVHLVHGGGVVEGVLDRILNDGLRLSQVRWHR